MDNLTYIDTKAKCRHLKKFPLRQVFIRVYRLEIQTVRTFAPLTFALAQFSSPLLPCIKDSKYSIYTDSVWLGVVEGVLSPVEDLILHEFNTLYLTRLRTYKIARPPQQKPRRGEGLKQISTCRKVPLQVNFF